MTRYFWVWLIIPTLLLSSAEAREIHVRGDARGGHEDGDASQPFRSITKAVQVAKPGDTVMIHAIEGGYRETVSLLGLAGGAPGHPITIDGQGSELVGSDPLTTEGWKFDAQRNLYERNDVNVRLILVVNGELVFASKVSPASLLPGQWCNEEGKVYYNLPEGKKLEELSIEASVRSNGVEIGGSTSHVVIKNFKARYFSNDGYNVHGSGKALEFYNCNARDMGDEGFSAHGLAETLLDGALYERCQNGILNVNTGGKSVSRNVVIREPRALGFAVSPRKGEAEHTLENAILLKCPVALRVGAKSTVRNAIILSDQPGARAAVEMEYGGVLEGVAISSTSATPLKVNNAASVKLSRVSINAVRAIRVAGEKPLGKTIAFNGCAVRSSLPFNKEGLAFQMISQTGEGNLEFPPVSTGVFLEMLLDEKLPGPSTELIRAALLELEKD